MIFKLTSSSNLFITTALTVLASTLAIQSEAFAWKITRTGQELPANQTKIIGDTSLVVLNR